jgi:hypothetical protein
LHANSDNALRLAAVHGQGLAMVPSFLVKDEIKSGRLIPVLTGFLQAEYPINAIYAHRHHLSAKVRSFIDLLVKHFREDPAWADPCRVHLAARPGNSAAAPSSGTDGVLASQSVPRQTAA